MASNQLAANYPLNQYSSGTLAVSASVKASSGKVVTAVVTNSTATGVYFQIHDKASAPASTEVPLVSVYVPGNTTFQFQKDYSIYCATGIAFGTSSTAATYTAAAGSLFTFIQYM